MKLRPLHDNVLVKRTEEEETSTESDDGGINMPATMSQKDKFNCPNTSTDKCPPVQRIQNLVFGLTEANPN